MLPFANVSCFYQAIKLEAIPETTKEKTGMLLTTIPFW
jgi:hypothetical protein